MTDHDLLQLADREIQRLTDENDHGAVIIMRNLAERLRAKIATPGQLRAGGMLGIAPALTPSVFPQNTGGLPAARTAPIAA